MKLSLIKQQIQKSLDMWNFHMVDKLYQNNFESFDELKSEYIEFLYNTGQLCKLADIANKYVKQPNWWNINLDFDAFKNIFSKYLTCNNLDIFRNFLDSNTIDIFKLNELIKNMSLEANFAIYMFSNNLIKCSELVKNFVLSSFIDYFTLSNEANKKRFFIMRYKGQPKNIFDCQSKLINYLFHSKEDGAKNYLLKYHEQTRKILYLNLKNKFPQKKIAICFYGVFRGGWKENLQEIINIIAKPLNADCFLFSWDEYQQWPSINGSVDWASRSFNKEISIKVPEIIKNRFEFQKLMPLTYRKLLNEYYRKINIIELENFINNNNCIKSYKLENQNIFNYNYFTVKMFYGWQASYNLMRQYEILNSTEYDIVILCRNDIKATSIDLKDIDIMQPNEIMEYSFSGSGIIMGYREAIKNYLSHFYYSDILQNDDLILSAYNNHEIGHKYPLFMGYNIVKGGINFSYISNHVINGYFFPDVMQEVKKDCKNLINNGADKNKVDLIEKFFNFVTSSLKPINNDVCINNSRSYVMMNKIALYRIQNQLSYKLGQAMILNSNSICGYIKMPFILADIKKKYKKEQMAYSEKIKDNSSLKLPPLESYPDYQEAIKIKEHLSYKLGEALIKAHKNWYKGGYIKLWFDIAKIKKQHKNKKAKNENR